MIERYKPGTEIDKSGADAVRDKFDRLVMERRDLKARLKGNSAALKDAVAAGRLFGVDIELPADVDHLLSPASLQVKLPETGQPSLFEASGETTIRQAVLDQLKMAAEKGVKASALRRVIENMLGRQLHYKTIGMTLYRLSEKGLARRDRLVWYYAPQGANENPGVVSAGAKTRA